MQHFCKNNITSAHYVHMRIAFVGKGGSGKTTVSALFSLFMDSIGNRVGLVDVDVNSHTAEVLGAKSDEVTFLSDEPSQDDILRYLAGTNIRVKPNEFLNTTPPGQGSGVWTLDDDNAITATYGYAFGSRSHVFTLGSYTDKSIGADCHHTTQHIAENILSHAVTNPNDIIVVDSVAGNDTFANSLYLQDILLFVVKPEREGLKVFERYYEMARKAGIAQRVFAVGNNVGSLSQRVFLEKNLPPDVFMGCIGASDAVIERRLEDLPLSTDLINQEMKVLFDTLYGKLQSLAKTDKKRHADLIELHKKVSSQSWVAGSYRAGLEDQIDPHYSTSQG